MQQPTNAPSPLQPVPTPLQLAWQEMEFYAFVHFNMNTFTDREWGLGDEQPGQFNPTQLDCRQWVRVFKEAGLGGVILTAKHHDGFCLWPSAYTEHSVKNSPWRQGRGDVVGELAAACAEYEMKMGLYLSPWDRHHAAYGQPEYIDFFRNQLRELLTGYGDIFEVWFDGANGGTGYYGGANEERLVDKRSYYNWENTIALIRQWQPQAIIWSDAGPDARWVGNERGFAYDTTWSNLYRDKVYGGMPEYASDWAMGQEEGTYWVPAEADVSIRPGWYYHEGEDEQVKSLSQLLDIYYGSIGRNCNLLLNFPVDGRGLVHENDAAQLQLLSKRLQEDFAVDLARGKKARATNERGADFSAAQAVDGDAATYWAAEDGVIEAGLSVDLGAETRFNCILLQEYIALGQRVKAFAVEVETPQGWQQIATGTTIGYKRILRLPDTRAQVVRVQILAARACPTMAAISVYKVAESSC